MAWYQIPLTGVSRVDDFLGLSADFNVGGGSYTFQGLRAATGSGEPVEYNQFLSALVGLFWKEPVRAASTGNITLSAPGTTIDGVTMSNGDRFLAKDQTTPAQNGIYEWNGAASAATRAADADSWDELVSAASFISEGTTNADTGYVCTVDDGGTLGTTDVTWVQFNGASNIVAGNGLDKSGNTLHLDFVELTEGSSPDSGDWLVWEDASAPGTFFKIQKGDLLAGAVPGNHASTHITGGSDEIDGDQVDVDWNPTYYTPATTPAEVTSVDHLTAHLYGIDQALNGKQASNAGLTDIAGLAKTDSNFIVGNGTNWVAETGATARTSLGLGTANYPQFTGINIGHANDTTLTRVSAGVIAIEGSTLATQTWVGTGYQPLDSDLTTWAAVVRASGFDTFAATPTKANLSALVSDGTVMFVGDAPTAHAASHQNGGSDEIRLDQLGEPTAAVDFNKQPANNFAYQTWANDAGRPGTPGNYQIGFNINRGVPEMYLP